MYITDSGPKNKVWTEALFELYGVKNIRTLPYYLQANSIVERGYALVVNALAKL